MVRRRYRRISLRTVIAASLIPLLFLSVGYALFSQKLNIQGKGTAAVSDNQQSNLTIEWTRSSWQSGSNWSYNMNGKIINNGTVVERSWEIVVQIPAGVTITGLSCWSAECSMVGNKIYVSNASYNGTLNSAASTTFGVSFTSNTSNLSFDGSTASGAPPENESQFVALAGLTATLSPNGQWQSGGRTVKAYDVAVNNNTGQKVKSWRIEISDWKNANYTVAGIWNADYLASPPKLYINSQGSLNAGASHSFGVQLSVPSSSWQPVYVIKGKV